MNALRSAVTVHWGGGGFEEGKERKGKGNGGTKKRKEERYEEGRKEKSKRWKVGGIYTQRPAVPIGKINQENHLLI
jgi:hypothetical protein